MPTTVGKATEFITFSRGTLATVTDSDGLIKWAPHNLLLASEQFDASNWSKTEATVTANTVAAPNGTSTADTIAENTANDVHALSQSVGTLTAENYTYSVFLKYNNLQYVTISFNQSSVSTAWASAIFDIQNGTLASSNASGGPSIIGTPTISPIGSGWYLCSVTANLGSAVGGQVYLASANTSSGASFRGAQVYTGSSRLFYAWGAHLYRSDLGGMQANASAYPYYNPSTPKNLLGYTELLTTGWTNTDTTDSQVAVAAPNGSANSIEVTATAGNGTLLASLSLLASPYTFSVWLKRKTGTGTVEITVDGTTYVTAAVTSDWQRFSTTLTPSAGTKTPGIRLVTSGDAVYAWGAQLSDSASLDPYSPVFGAAPSAAAYHGPRLDYDPVTLAAKGLLVEEARTNLYLNSETPATQVATLTSGSTYTISMTGGSNVVDLDETIAVTAVDVFVYDTSKDSDGGAWRTGALAQASSWYNETLNTATRGSRREFPEVAVIVAESNKVTIYDGDDPTLPMWMVFNGGVFGDISNVKAVYALNGIIAVGSTARGIPIANLVADYGEYQRNSTEQTLVTGGLVNRNTYNFSTGSAALIVNNDCNDVAMTVLPGAPTDPATGMKVPTIAVGTVGGISVIRDDGTVVDSANTGNFFRIAFDNSYAIWGTDINGVDDINVFATYDADGFSFSGAIRQYYSGSTPSTLADPLTALLAGASGYSKGLTLIDENPTTPSEGMVAYATSTYNTGWMNGDIKGAFLSDTSATNLVGSGELVTNGDFATASDWTLETGWSITGGQLVSTSSAQNTSVRQTITTVVGQRYVLFADVVVSAGTLRLYVQEGATTKINTDNLTVGTHKVQLTWVATSTSTIIRPYSWGVGTNSGTIDNVSVKLADADRSVNNNGLIVNGTITRTAVASGADLVAYSGFSSSDYLEQPYNSALDFGTGDFCVMGWFYKATSNSRNAFERRKFDNSDDTGRFALLSGTDNKVVFSAYDVSSVGIVSLVSANAISPTSWVHFAAVRAGSTATLYINGEADATDVTASGDITSAASDATLIVGCRHDLANSWDGSLALLRISATAPTAAQILKIYNDEKVLFQSGAKATLYGASDAVTALAHDPDTDLLHVGTSAGRSVFQGLRRISNSTTAVSTAISANNGVIAEQ